jgi:hypothetical protein
MPVHELTPMVLSGLATPFGAGRETTRTGDVAVLHRGVVAITPTFYHYVPRVLTLLDSDLTVTARTPLAPYLAASCTRIS